MSDLPAISFARPETPSRGTVVLFTGEGLGLGAMAAGLAVGAAFERAAEFVEFKAKPMSSLDILAPGEGRFSRVAAVGMGRPAELREGDWARLGGTALGVLRKGESAAILLERPDGVPVTPEQAADFALGIMLRAYVFDRYKRDSDAEPAGKKRPGTLTIHVVDSAKAKRAFEAKQAVGLGVHMARDLVHEPANLLGPTEFVERLEALPPLGIELEILTEKDMKKLKMGALLGVGQGSVRPPRIAVMRWNGGRKDEAPVAFIGKGVVFDSGGISIKPAQGMEDMKGDMAGAAAVTGLMRALAGRKAKVNAVGVIGVVENMPDGNAQRPGDIVTAMSGQTIEVVNTDAEGRLVLADVITYVQQKLKPRLMIDLATLTGAVIIALGHHHAGMFSTDDDIAEALRSAGEATGERVWRLPLGPEYDKLMDSKFADMKNTGGRAAGSITGAQFIKRFVKDVPWVHLDIAGTAMDSPQTEINKSWASGFGVRLLDRFVTDRYEG
ncbi:MAG: leucyl aminopeptidase [Bauldia sp.]